MRLDIYSRKSSADGGKSVAQQEEDLGEGIADHGWAAGRTFTDDNRSASRYAVKPRESYDALVAHIAAGDCEAIGLWETARGGRREVTYFELLELCRAHETRIYVFTHDRLYDLARRSDWRALAQEVIDSADMSAKISEGSQRGKRKIAKLGRPDGRLLYGYEREYDPMTGEYLRQVEHPEQAPIVRRMAEAVVQRESASALARKLNAEGVPTAMGKQWRGRDIGRLVQNPAYVCKRVHRKEVLPDVEADWPNILDMDTWRTCCRILKDPDRLTHDTSDLKWFLTGVIPCGLDGCDGVLRVHRGAGARRYACVTCWRLAVSGEALDQYVTAVVRERLAKSDAKDLFLARSDGAALGHAEGEAKQLHAELAEWRALAKARKVSPASFADIEANLLPKVAQADAVVRRLTAPAPLPELEGIDVGARWFDFSPGIQREVVRLLMDIRILPAKVRGAPFTPQRLRNSRWAGDERTWGEIWAAERG